MRKTININKNLDQKVNEEMKKNDTTYTFIVNMALNDYFEMQEIKSDIKNKMLDRLEKLDIKKNEDS